MLTLHTNVKMGAIGSKATSQLTNFDFNSYGKFIETHLGCATNGIYRIGGYTFDGEEIEAYIKTFKNKLGYDGNKRIRFVYIGVETAGTLTFTPTVDGVAKTPITITPKTSGTQYLRVAVGRYKGCYYDFKIENVDGAWFALEHISVLPTYLAMGR